MSTLDERVSAHYFGNAGLRVLDGSLKDSFSGQWSSEDFGKRHPILGGDISDIVMECPLHMWQM